LDRKKKKLENKKPERERERERERGVFGGIFRGRKIWWVGCVGGSLKI